MRSLLLFLVLMGTKSCQFKKNSRPPGTCSHGGINRSFVVLQMSLFLSVGFETRPPWGAQTRLNQQDGALSHFMFSFCGFKLLFFNQTLRSFRTETRFRNYDKFSEASFPHIQWCSATSAPPTPSSQSPPGEPHPPVLPARPAPSCCHGGSCHGDRRELSGRWWHCYHGDLSSCPGGASRYGGIRSAAARSRVPRQKASDAGCNWRALQPPSPRRRQEPDRTR